MGLAHEKKRITFGNPFSLKITYFQGLSLGKSKDNPLSLFLSLCKTMNVKECQ